MIIQSSSVVCINVDENADVDEDDYDFASVGQGIRSVPNRARRNVNFRGIGNYEDMDRENIKLKIPNFGR